MFNVLVIGDIILDNYLYVESIRNAQESDIPVWDVIRRETRLGGAANVANNLKSLGKENVNVFLAGICSNNNNEMSHFINNGIICDFMDCDHGNTLTKTRYVSKDKIIFRSDNIKKVNYSYYFDNTMTGSYYFLKQAYKKNWHAVIVSDYDKGTIDNLDFGFINSKLLIVDSKRKNLNKFKGFDVLKLNQSEFNLQLCNKEDYENFEELFKNVVVTRGKNGAHIRNTQKLSNGEYRLDIHAVPVDKKIEKDVTGCGDTHTAALTYSLLLDSDIYKAVKFANKCASKVVEKFGTSIIEKREVE